MLPKFLVADNSQDCPDTIYVIHTETPRFIVSSDVEAEEFDVKNIHWIDQKPNSEETIEALMQDAEDFLSAELDYQDILLGEDEEDEDF